MYRFFQRLSLTTLVLIISLMYPILSVSAVSAEFPIEIFETLGISLKENIATTYFAGDSILIEGKVINGQKYARFFLQNATTSEPIIDKLVSADEDGIFKMPINFPKIEGKYYTVMVGGGSAFRTTKLETIQLIAKTPPVSTQVPISSIVPKIQYTTSIPYISFGPNLWANMYIEQSGKILNTSGKVITLDHLSLKSGISKISANGYAFSGVSPVTNSIDQGFTWTDTVYMDRVREKIGEKYVTFQKKGIVATMQFRLKPGMKVQKKYYLTAPDGNVEEYEFSNSVVGSDGYLLPNILIRQRFAIPMDGVYKIEAVREDGIAYFNLPISKNIFWSIVEPLSENEKSTIRTDKKVIDRDILNRINTIRKGLGLSSLVIDQKLTELAGFKASDMAKYDYISHRAHNGLFIRDFGNELGISIPGALGENIAKGINSSDLNLQDGLEESGSHRHAMINPTYKKIGIGYATKNGKTYLVQVFGE